MNFSVAGLNLRDMFQMHTINLSVGSMGRVHRTIWDRYERWGNYGYLYSPGLRR